MWIIFVKKSQMEGIEYTLDFQSFGNYTEIDAAIVEAIKKHAEELWKNRSFTCISVGI